MVCAVLNSNRTLRERLSGIPKRSSWTEPHVHSVRGPSHDCSQQSSWLRRWWRGKRLKPRLGIGLPTDS
jgi:hypothetical protein